MSDYFNYLFVHVCASCRINTISMVRLENEVEQTGQLPSNRLRPRSHPIKDQIRKTHENTEITRWERFCRYCCYRNERASTWAKIQMDRQPLQMTCPNCRYMILTRRQYEVMCSIYFVELPIDKMCYEKRISARVLDTAFCSAACLQSSVVAAKRSSITVRCAMLHWASRSSTASQRIRLKFNRLHIKIYLHNKEVCQNC